MSDLEHIVTETRRLSRAARLAFLEGHFARSEKCLTSLRELLNSQPELEAGGSRQKESSS